MSNNDLINETKAEIYKLETLAKHEQNVDAKIKHLEKLVDVRTGYSWLLTKKRPMLLTFALVFCIFWGISLMICLPPYIVRGKKRDINEERIKQIQVEISVLRSQKQTI